MNDFKYPVISILAATLSACASVPPPANIISPMSDNQTDLISRDFVTAISKLRGFIPRETTVQFYAPNTLFENKMHDAMRGAGYGIQVISKEDTAKNLLTYESDMYESSNGSTIAYEVSVGTITLGREYELRDTRVFPITALSVKGNTSSTTGNVDNTLFNYQDQTIDEMSTNGSKHSILLIGEDSGLQAPAIRSKGIRDEHDYPVRPKQNMAILGESNYTSLFTFYKPVKKYTLVFGDDSLRLGKNNKKLIHGLAAQYNPKTDVISVIGCSHGKTRITNGNALLANGRASRVKEELIMANIEPDKILDEGCWAADKYRDMPVRGVLLTLRSKS